MGLLREDGTPKRARRNSRASTPGLGVCQWFHFEDPRLDDAVRWLKELGVHHLRTGLSWADISGRTRSSGSTARWRRCEPTSTSPVTFCFTPEHKGVEPHHTSPPTGPARVRRLLRRDGPSLRAGLIERAVTTAFLQQLQARNGPIATPTAIIVAHQDDEVIGIGSRLPRLTDAHIVYATDGAPPDLDDAARLGFPSLEVYAAAREREAQAALALAGIGPERVRRLGYTDQRASLDMAALTRSVLTTLRELRPDVVVTHPFENGHPDHDATAFAVHLARRLLREAGEPAPALVEFASYHDPDGSRRMAVQSFLPADTPEILVELDEAAQDLKRRLVACHASQQQVLQAFPTDRERYRVAPAYDFLAPPHPWRPFYETFFAMMTRERWQGLAAQALAALDLPERRFRC